MGFFDFFRRKKNGPESSTNQEDWTVKLPKYFVEAFIGEIEDNFQATRSDQIEQGIGEFGLEKSNPVPTFGIPSSDDYLRSLRNSNGEILRYRRTGSFEVENIIKKVDEYEIFNSNGETIAFLYLSPYHWVTSTRSPVGFYFKGRSKATEKLSGLPVDVFNQKSAYAEFQEKVRREEERKYKQQQSQENLFKPEWKKYKTIVSNYGIHSLYHFTDRSNLKSIVKHGGLYSWYHCSSNNINIPVPGGGQLSRDLDQKKGLQDFVRVSFTRSHPMMFVTPIRNRDNVILEIDTEVVYWLGTKYADKNATRNDVNVGSTFNDFEQLRLDIFKYPNHFGLSEDVKPYYQAEILIPKMIPIRYIKNLNALLQK